MTDELKENTRNDSEAFSEAKTAPSALLCLIAGSNLVSSINFPPDAHPVTNYLVGLTKSSRRTMKQSLDRIAQKVVGDDEVDAMAFNWPALEYSHTNLIRAWLAEEFAPSTANKCLAALKGVLKECWRLRYTSAEEYHRAIDLKTIRGIRLPPGRRLPVGEMRAFFKHCAKDRSAGAVFDATIFAVLVGAGLRREEAAKLKVVDFDAEEKTLKVNGKGNKERSVPLQSTATDALLLWLSIRGGEPGALLCPVRKNGTIVVRHMSDQALYARLSRRATKAGVKPFTPHDLRRTYASGMLDMGADVFAVQMLLGHANVATTQRYDYRDEKAKRKAAELFHLPYVAFEPQLGESK